MSADESMATQLATKRALLSLSDDQRNDLQLASSKMTGAERREFRAEMTLKYCNGKAHQAERVFNWCRHSVK